MGTRQRHSPHVSDPGVGECVPGGGSVGGRGLCGCGGQSALVVGPFGLRTGMAGFYDDGCPRVPDGLFGARQRNLSCRRVLYFGTSPHPRAPDRAGAAGVVVLADGLGGLPGPSLKRMGSLDRCPLVGNVHVGLCDDVGGPQQLRDWSRAPAGSGRCGLGIGPSMAGRSGQQFVGRRKSQFPATPDDDGCFGAFGGWRRVGRVPDFEQRRRWGCRQYAETKPSGSDRAKPVPPDRVPEPPRGSRKCKGQCSLVHHSGRHPGTGLHPGRRTVDVQRSDLGPAAELCAGRRRAVPPHCLWSDGDPALPGQAELRPP